MKLGLGTAQFGMDYGVANTSGQVSVTEVSAILAVAAANGIDLIDTASLYGESEQVLGGCLSKSHTFKIVTKTPYFSSTRITVNDGMTLRNVYRDSLEKLRQESLYALLIHNADDLLKSGGDILYEEMQRLKDDGLVMKIGVSVYSGQQLDELSGKYPLDLVQLPLNIFDQRLLKSGHLRRLKLAGTEIHVRSAYLQGLLHLAPEELPPSLNRLLERLRQYREALGRWNITIRQAPLWFLADIGEIDYVVCGVDSRAQLEEICLIAQASHDRYDFCSFAIDDESLINPTHWKK